MKHVLTHVRSPDLSIRDRIAHWIVVKRNHSHHGSYPRDAGYRTDPASDGLPSVSGVPSGSDTSGPLPGWLKVLTGPGPPVSTKKKKKKHEKT